MELVPGDRLPFCVGVGIDRDFYSSDIQAGRAAVLVLCGPTSSAAPDALLASLAARQAELRALDADLLVLLGFAALPRLHRNGAAAGPRVILCPDEFFASCASILSNGPIVVLIDRAARIVACWRSWTSEPDRVAGDAVETARRLAREAAVDCLLPAPVLAIPGLLDRAFCRELIERFEASETFDSAISGTAADGTRCDRLDHERKCRRDWLLEPGDGVHDRVLDCLTRRCVPDIRRVFQHEVTQIDRILVARYDEAVGMFKRHRDNTGPAVAFRQFALSVNLNTGEYEGGYLLFPEFNDHRYRPASGDGLVFSASLLHEATRVLSGRRYALLTFLHDNERNQDREVRGSALYPAKGLPLETIT